MNRKIIIFGYGYYGKCAYEVLKDRYEVLAFVDNNHSYHGKIHDGKEVLGASILTKIDLSTTDIIICSKYYYQIAEQLINIGVIDYYVMLEGMLYHSNQHETMIPVEISNENCYKRTNDRKNIVFAQNAVCIRTNRLAQIMKELGYTVHLLYTLAPISDAYSEYKKVYDYQWYFSSVDGIRKFVESSDFDIVHCSNEPDILANILRKTNKPVVFDTHDMQSIRSNVGIDTLVLEYLANTKSNGNIYASQNVEIIASAKYGLQNMPLYSIDNLVMDEVVIEKPYEKISKVDGAIHCVYEGGVVGENKEHHRYFDDMWKKITAAGIHIHFYSQSELCDCKRLESLSELIHYEGNAGGEKLILEMTKYDCGLALFNSNYGNRLHLESTSINKVYEYINAGLPIVSSGIASLSNMVTKYKVGDEIDYDADIKKQIEDISKIKIEKGFLTNNKLTIRSHADEIMSFYEKVIERSQK